MKTKFFLVLFLAIGSFVNVNSGCLITTTCGVQYNTMGPGFFSNCYYEYMRYLEDLNDMACGYSGTVEYECYEDVYFRFEC